MPTFKTKVNNHTSENYVQYYINKWTYENFQPIESLDDTQIETLGNSLEAYLQTEIGTPNGYTITLKLVDIRCNSSVDDIENLIRNITELIYDVTIV